MLFLLSGHSFMKGVVVPPFTKCPGNEEKSNNSTSLLLELYPLYIKSILCLDSMQLDVLKDVCPPSSELNGVKLQGKHSRGFKNDGSFFNLEQKLPRLDSLVPKRWLFSYFFTGVLSGGIDCDEIAEFQKHMAPHMKVMRKMHTEAVEDPTFLPKPNYTPPPLSDEPTTPKPKIDVLKKRYAVALKELFKFGAAGEIEAPFAGVIANVHLGAMFCHYQSLGVIKRVIFDNKKLEEVCQNDDSDPFAGHEKLMEMVEKEYTHEKSEKKKRGLTASGTSEKSVLNKKRRRLMGRSIDADLEEAENEAEDGDEEESEDESSTSSNSEENAGENEKQCEV
jgi:hypothetical protein